MVATPSRPPRRNVVGSRNPTARPRRVAGQRGEQPVETQAEGPVETPVEETPAATVPPADVQPEEKAGDPGGGLLGSLRTTAVLVAVIVLLVAAAAGESWYLWLRDGPTVSAARPVVTGQLAHQAAVEAASSATEEILSTSYKDYDAQVDQATSKMTGSFAGEYRQTVQDIRDKFIAEKTDLQVKVVAAGVVRASSQQVQALLFLNQYVQKPGTDTAFRPYRALVTVVHTDHGWLVSDIQTQ